MHKILTFFFIFGLLVGCSKDENSDTSTGTSALTDIKSLTDYDATIQSGVSLIFFHATWCSICSAQRPNVEGLSGNTSITGAKLGQVDTDKNKDIINKYSVSGQPVIIIYKNNVEKHRLLGQGHSKEKLADLIKALL